MKLRSGRLYKNDRSDIAGIWRNMKSVESRLQWIGLRKRLRIYTEAGSRYPASSQLFIQQIMQNGEYQKRMEQFVREQDNKELLISFESKYPGATTSEKCRAYYN